MLTPPNNQETFALCLSIENGIKLGTESEALKIANVTVDNYVGTILQKLSNQETGAIEVKPVSVIHELSNTQLWVLCYVAVQNILTQLQGNLSYTLMSAIETFKELNPEIKIEGQEINSVDITNIIFTTEYDLAVAFIGLEHILNVVMINHNQMEAQKLEQNKENK